jgi:hypothetical protein
VSRRLAPLIQLQLHNSNPHDRPAGVDLATRARQTLLDSSLPLQPFSSYLRLHLKSLRLLTSSLVGTREIPCFSGFFDHYLAAVRLFKV